MVSEDGIGGAAEQGHEVGGGGGSVGFGGSFGSVFGGIFRGGGFSAGFAAVGLKFGIDPACKAAEEFMPAAAETLAQPSKSLAEALLESFEGGGEFLE